MACLGVHSRPQEDRHHVWRCGDVLVPLGRYRSIANPRSALHAERHSAHSGAIQPNIHHAWNHNGFPGDYAPSSGIR